MFCIEKGNNSREQLAIINGARKLGIDHTTAKVCPIGMIPIGTVQFCEAVFGSQPEVKDFFPMFLRGRFLWREMEMVQNPILGERMFYKKATEWKSNDPSAVYSSEFERESLDGLYWVSEVVNFVQEWRYYVARGELVATGWYDGFNEDEPAPELDIDWPKGFSAAVDFGRLDNGNMELVEAHAPYACGHYCERHEDYALWQYMAWNSRDYWTERQKNERRD